MGLSFDTETRYITSISEDGFLRTTDISTKEIQYEELINATGIKYLIDDKENKRLFLADGEGWVYIYSKKHYPPECIIKV